MCHFVAVFVVELRLRLEKVEGMVQLRRMWMQVVKVKEKELDQHKICYGDFAWLQDEEEEEQDDDDGGEERVDEGKGRWNTRSAVLWD